jgi:hypothetical protein
MSNVLFIHKKNVNINNYDHVHPQDSITEVPHLSKVNKDFRN